MIPNFPSPLLSQAESDFLTTFSDLSGNSVLSQTALLFGLVLANAFFVAAEYAIANLRSSHIEDLVSNGKRSAFFIRKILEKIDGHLSACQLGITLSSIALGAVSEPFVSALVQPFLLQVGLEETAIRILSFIFGVTVITFLHVVIGEQLPKVLGIHKALRTASICSRPLHLFYLIFSIPIWLMTRCSTFLLKHLFRVDAVEGYRIIHSADELRVLVEETGEAHEVTPTEQEIAVNALALSDLAVRDILTPRNDVISMDVHKTFQENLTTALESKHTRFPLIDEHLDKTIGLIHIKDLLGETQAAVPDLMRVKRNMINVSENMPLDEMLKQFLDQKAHIALVLDEFGGSLGLVMLDDVLDQIVGDIHDEFDVEDETAFRRISDDEFVVAGTYPLHELSDEVEDLNLENPDVSTVGGYITSLIGHLPEKGETVEVDGYQAEVMEADDRTIQEISFVRVEESLEDEEALASED